MYDEPGSSDMALSREEKRGDFFGVSVEVDQNRFVGGEERIERVFRQGVRVLAVLAEDHEVDDVDDSDSNTFGSQKRRGGDDLVRYFYADTDEYDIRLHSVVC